MGLVESLSPYHTAFNLVQIRKSEIHIVFMNVKTLKNNENVDKNRCKGFFHFFRNKSIHKNIYIFKKYIVFKGVSSRNGLGRYKKTIFWGNFFNRFSMISLRYIFIQHYF